MKDIEYTQSGQPRPYADSVYAGTVKADSEEEAREKLSRSGKPMRDWSDPERPWYETGLKKLKQTEPGLWEFYAVQEYTG